jgi:hypothetical protein
VPIHTIAWIAENALRLLGCEEYYTKRFGFNLDPEDSDLLVSIQSARGGALPLGTTEELAGVCHTQETGPRLLERLPPLLNSPTARSLSEKKHRGTYDSGAAGSVFSRIVGA